MTNYYIEVLLLCRKIKNIDLILVFTARNILKIPKAEELNRKKKYFGLTRDYCLILSVYFGGSYDET